MPSFRSMSTAVVLVTALVMFPSAGHAAAAPTTVVPDFQLSVSASAIGHGKNRASLIRKIRLRADGIGELTPWVKCDAKRCRRLRGGGKGRTISNSGSVTFTNVRWRLPRGQTFTIAINKKGFLGRYKTLRRKVGSFTQFVVVREGCTKRGFTPAACPPPSPASPPGSPLPLIQTGAQIVNPHSGKCLDVTAASIDDGTRVQIYSCNSTIAQTWRFSSGLLMVYGDLHTRCLDVTGNAQTNETLMQIWGCNGGAAQQFSLNPNGTIISTAGFCLDVRNAGMENLTPVQLYSCNGGAAQQWTWDTK